MAYELGYRRARERTVILMVDSKDDLPVYETAVAYQDWRQDDVLKGNRLHCRQGFPPLNDFKVDIPGALKDVIDARDDGLIRTCSWLSRRSKTNLARGTRLILCRSSVACYLMRSPDFIRFRLSKSAFSKQGEFEDPKAPAKVVDFDEDFSRLYGYVGKSAAIKDRPHTLDRLLNRMSEFSDADDWDKFLQEQKKLTD